MYIEHSLKRLGEMLLLKMETSEWLLRGLFFVQVAILGLKNGRN